MQLLCWCESQQYQRAPTSRLPLRGGEDLAEARDEVHRQRLVKEPAKCLPLHEQLFTSLRGALLPRMAEALLLFQQPALAGREKIKFEGKRNGFGAVPYFICASLLPVLNNPFVQKAGTFPLVRRELRHFNLQLALGIWFCFCTQKNE